MPSLEPANIDAMIGPTSVGPELRAVAVTTLFGAFARRGTSGELGNDTDSKLLGALREWADVILVGAGTVAAEDYGPAATPMAVVSRSLSLDPGLGIFRGSRLLVLAPELSLIDAALKPHTHNLISAGAELHSTGAGRPGDIVALLHSLGFNRILCEGGPSLYAAMLAADLVDVMHLTVEASISNQDSSFGLTLPPDGEFVRRFALEDATVDADSTLFLRYRRVPDGSREDPR